MTYKVITFYVDLIFLVLVLFLDATRKHYPKAMNADIRVHISLWLAGVMTMVMTIILFGGLVLITDVGIIRGWGIKYIIHKYSYNIY